jgi:pyruvate kinase
LAAYRPKVPIFVKCFDPRRVRQLALLYGVRAHFLNEKNYQSDLLPKVLRDLVKKGSRQSSDLVIFLNSDVDGNGSANTMEICEVGKYVK